ncbi:MAG: hypothetical protein ABIP93_06395 [Gemmatimonadaceae bacterium]
MVRTSLRFSRALAVATLFGCAGSAPMSTASAPDRASPAVLPGRGLAQHPFFYAGEWDYRRPDQTMFIVRDGTVVWSYSIKLKDERNQIQEWSDATLLANGNVVFARKTGAGVVGADKRLIWNYDAPPGFEVHVSQPIGLDRMLMVQNGNPAKAMIVNYVTGKIEKEVVLPTARPANTHGHFRRVRLTDAGTLLATHLDMNRIAEYDWKGKELWSLAVQSPWGANQLKNGNILFTTGKGIVREVTRRGATVWEFGRQDVPDIKLCSLQEANRLANGNTVISNWCASDIKDTAAWHGAVQVLEVTPDKRVVWALRSWDAPADFGPPTVIQLLDEPGAVGAARLAPTDRFDDASPSGTGFPTVALPGNGIAQHPFLVTGEWDHRKPDQTLFVVRDGKVAWSHAIPIKDADGTMQELGDATMLSNGNIVFSRKTGASVITPAKKIVWDYPAPKGTEIHSIQPIGRDRVAMVINGNPARLLVVNTATNSTEKELALPTPRPNNPHLQFRRVRVTPDGTYLAAHLDDNRVIEYDQNGKQIWSFTTYKPWSAVRLANGNTLMTSAPTSIVEVDRSGAVVWEFSQKDVPGIPLFQLQEVSRLKNGNTLVSNWCPANGRDPKSWPGTVQLLEISPDKRVVWAVSQWKDPDLGPFSSIQLLDEPGAAERGDYQR